MKKIAVIHGPNLDMLGKREPEIYGNITLKDINEQLISYAAKLKLNLDIYQSQIEGELITEIHRISENKYQGCIINPAAYTHTSVAIRDALSLLKIPIIEVHLSNIHAREEFRQKSLTAAVCTGQVSGFGVKSYLMALSYFDANL